MRIHKAIIYFFVGAGGVFKGGFLPLKLEELVGLVSLLILLPDGLVKLLLDELRRGVGMLLMLLVLLLFSSFFLGVPPRLEVDPTRLSGVVVDVTDDRREEGALLLTGVDLPLDLLLASSSSSSLLPTSWIDRLAAPSSHLLT